MFVNNQRFFSPLCRGQGTHSRGPMALGRVTVSSCQTSSQLGGNMSHPTINR